MKIIKCIISLCMLIAIFTLSGCNTSKPADFSGTWYGISDDKIIKADIEKKDNFYYVTTSYGYYLPLRATSDTTTLFWTGFGRYNGQKHKPIKAEAKNGVMHFVGSSKTLDWTMNKDGNIEGQIDFFSLSAGPGTLQKAEKVKLEDLKKAIEEPSKKGLRQNSKFIFTDEQPRKL